MTPAKTEHQTSSQTDLALLESIRKSIWEQLEKEKARVYAEIRCYPPPIPACDVQFNYLLEERAKLSQELGQVEAISMQQLMPEAYGRWLDDFIGASAYING